MTNEEILKLVEFISDADKVPAWHNGMFTLTMEEMSAFHKAAFNEGLEAAAKVCDESEVANLYGEKECAAAIRSLKEMK